MYKTNILKLQKCILKNRYEISLHAEKERRQENIELQEVEEAILKEEIIEEYPDDPRGPSCLVLGYSGQRPIHIVSGLLSTGWARIITVYTPREPKWVTPRQRRQK